jgi:hypothetical protein
MNKIKTMLKSASLTLAGSALAFPAYAAITVPTIDDTDFETAATGVLAFIVVVVVAGVVARFFKKV